MDLRADQRPAPTLSPRQQHGVRLLQMSALDFAALLRDCLDRNPFLEPDDEGGAAAGGLAPLAALPDAGPALAEAGADRAFWLNDAGRHGTADDGAGALEQLPVQASLTAHLHGQLNVLPLPARDLALARTIVDSLDDDGYLRTPLDELHDLAGLAPGPDAQEMRIALRRVQALEPVGVGARSVAECLQLQVAAMDDPPARSLAQAIVRDHLAALAARDVGTIARRLARPLAQVQAVCDRIRRLDPRPGWRFGPADIAYTVPDVIVQKVRGVWRVQLNPAVVPRVRLNEVVAHLFQQHRSAAHAELQAQLQEARWTLRNVEQRFATIVDVAQAIVDRQQRFLENGPMAMQPLGLREIADEVGVHESTVSRVTHNKYIATPLGVLALKSFFGRAMLGASGRACSGTAIRSLVQDIIASEPPEAPLSDGEIARRLACQGLSVARRTVTKYRQMLRIEAVERRRRLA